MAVIYWQIGVASSVVLAFLFAGRKAALIACVLWSLWTLVMLFSAPLIIIQLGVAWGSYFVCKSIADSFREAAHARAVAQRRKEQLAEQERKVRKLQLMLDEFMAAAQMTKRTEAVVREAAKVNPDNVTFVSGAEHYELLKKSIADSKKHITILSGWLGSPLLDPEIRSGMEAALSRGVDIYIGFGWESSAGHEMSDRSRQAFEVLRMLAEKRLRGSLFIGQFPNHEKILVMDDSFIVVGSNNWLSNRHFSNSERSVMVRNSEYARQEHDRAVSMIMNNVVISTQKVPE